MQRAFLTIGRGLVVLVIAFLITETVAHGQTPPARWQRDARIAAVNYWRNTKPVDPTCQLTVQYVRLPLSFKGLTIILQTDDTTIACSVQINSRISWSTEPYQFCLTVVHEVGHIVLGTDAFADSNPRDPAHSSNPDNVMFADFNMTRVKQCKEFAKTHHPYSRQSSKPTGIDNGTA